ncbi:MAG: potassium channel family protein [Acidobacteriota bacterium]
MLILLLIAGALVCGTVFVHAVGTAAWVHHLRALVRDDESHSFFWVLGILAQTALVLILLHMIEILLWATTYYLLPETGVASFEESIYFSCATFTTLGYGDVTLEPPWRLLTGIEALNGVLLIGWSTALSFAVIQASLNRSVSPRP